MEWEHGASPEEEEGKARIIPSAGKIIGTVFLDAKWCILVDFLPRKESVNAVHYVKMLQKLQQCTS
jgi:hypothetical protein